MNIRELAEKKIISKDGHFIPLVFVDMSVPTAFVGAAATAATKNINQNINDNKKKFSAIPVFSGICSKNVLNKEDIRNLLYSTDDIVY